MNSPAQQNGRSHLALGEIFSFAYETFMSNKIRFALTALGMVIGTASLILVTTIGLTGKQYLLNQIQAIGSNWIYAEYESGGQRITNTGNDALTIEDMEAVQHQVDGIVAASPVVPLNERVAVGGGKERDLQIMGVYPEYQQVRNLIILSGRVFDKQDSQAHNKVGVITPKLAVQLYGSEQASLGKTVKLSGLPFTVIGTFRERVDTFGQSEVTDNTMLIPYSVIRYFQETPTVKQIYFSTTDASLVASVTSEIRYQFLSEAILISLIGGIIGIVIGLAIPFSVRYLTEYRIPISGLSAIIAIVVSSLVGILFGTIPASRAAQLDPVESLRYE